MVEAGDSKSLSNLFTKGSHHRNLTLKYLVQNVYNQSKAQRTVSLNSHYNVEFRNKRDASQFRTLATQMCPGDWNWLFNAFEDVTRQPYGYMVFDHHPASSSDEAVLTNIFPGDTLTYYCRGPSTITRV